MTLRTFLQGKAAWVPVVTHGDIRGTLTTVDFAAAKFTAIRAFAVTAPDGAVRGAHAHRLGRQILMPVQGTIAVELRAGNDTESVTLSVGSAALLLEPGVWARQTYLGVNGASLVVFCDTPYDPDDYIHEP